MKNKISIVTILLVLFSTLFVLFLGIQDMNKGKPNNVYVIYLKGKQIGVVEDKEEFLDYINNKQKTIKKEYNVKKVHIPNGVNIRKKVTYNKKVDNNSQIYNKLIKEDMFTISGYIIKIKSKTEENKDKEPIVINSLNKEIFDEAVNNIILAFVDKDRYNAYMEGDQPEIVETGSIIENIDIEEKITYKKDYISTNEKIYKDASELSKFLLYGTTEKQETHIVENGETIASIAEDHQLNVQEFLVANPEFTSENNLLYESQEVNVGLINPLISVVEETHSVQDEERKYVTEIKYDSSIYRGEEYIERTGENGLDRVTRKNQYINGKLSGSTNVSTTEITPSVSQVLVRGEKSAPEIGDLSYWAWPTERPYSISSYYAYRWGSFHAAIDIIGPGHGSDIYAANNGVVYKVGTGCVPGNIGCNGRRGNYVIINHNIGGYYTHYLHMSKVTVREGQTVARGQKIGTMGNTGHVVPAPSSYSPYAGTHLDFGVYKGGLSYTINPLSIY